MANLRFESDEELAASFRSIERYVASHPPTELDLRLHWRKHLLLPEYHKLAVEVMKRLVADNNGLPLYSFLPECFEDKLGLTCFPDCGRCVLHEARWCKWPRQFTDKYYRTPQKSLRGLSPEKLTAEDFAGAEPVTWFTPARRDISLLARLFSEVPQVVDFGCGSGFVSSLILGEGCSAKILGVDPFAEPAMFSSGFSHSKDLREPHGPWALLSSLSDYHVPIERCFSGKNLPVAAAFIAFPQVFGRGGQKITVNVRGEELLEESRAELFSFGALADLGYELALARPVSSAFYPDCELRVYLRESSLRDVLREQVTARYPWEKSPSREAMSTDSRA